jgi:hypothetical protein
MGFDASRGRGLPKIRRGGQLSAGAVSPGAAGIKAQPENQSSSKLLIGGVAVYTFAQRSRS